MQERINKYLNSGGLFNPEMMDADQVRKLLIDAREYIAFLEARLKHSEEGYDSAMRMVEALFRQRAGESE